MQITLNYLQITYDRNHRGARLALRNQLEGLGFFKFPENKDLYDMFDKPAAEGEEVRQLCKAIQLYDGILMKEKPVNAN